MKVSPSVYKAIKNAPKGVVPVGIEVAKAAAKQATKKETYVSTRSSNFGDTYTKYGGVVSILKSHATPETKKQALAMKKSQEAKRRK